jgi:hypothetical protein
VTSHTTRRFRDALQRLPVQVRQQAREAYRLFAQNPYHPSLRFRQVHPSLPVYSARISADYRAVGARSGDEMVWFWLGPHTDYEHLISRL